MISVLFNNRVSNSSVIKGFGLRKVYPVPSVLKKKLNNYKKYTKNNLDDGIR